MLTHDHIHSVIERISRNDRKQKQKGKCPTGELSTSEAPNGTVRIGGLACLLQRDIKLPCAVTGAS